ncbi:MAG TPA: hypothetical protein VFZ33_03870 [Chitinophagaceae bacterium]
MKKYVEQLLADIAFATENVSWPFAEKQLELHNWMPADEEDKAAPVRELEEWTGIRKEMLPPEIMLDEEQLHRLLEALKKMLDVYNCSFVLQTQVPERIQYAAIRDNFDQPVKIKRWHMGFFELCRPGTEHKKCALSEYCQCAFYAELFSAFIDEDLTPEEERARELEIEVNHIKRKYGDEWMKYYPYHLDANYDDENGDPYNYGFDNEEDDEEDDNWWRK